MASGFIRREDDDILASGEVVGRWFDRHSSNSAPVSTTTFVQPSSQHPSVLPTILHLTDLHFGDEGHAWDDLREIPGVGRPSHDRLKLLNTLVQDLQALRDEHNGLWPGLVIVSGDFMFQCREEGVRQAVDFLVDLSAALDVERSRFVLCPGNHDQNRSILAEEPRAQFARYRSIWNDFYPEGFRQLPFEWIPGSYTHVYRIENLEILSLNSCEDLGPGDDPDADPNDQGYIGLQQLNMAAKLLGAEEPPDGFRRVAVLHHHLSQYKWASGLDYSILREVERVISWLRKYHFDLVFHGHQHCVGTQTRVVDGRYLTVLAGGSAGVVTKYRWRGGMPLMYQVILGVEENRAVRLCRSFDLHEERWIAYPHEITGEIPIGFLA